MQVLDEKQELLDRIEARKKRLEARMTEPRADSNARAREEAQELQERLDELGGHLKDGWDDLTESVAHRLNQWLQKHESTGGLA